MQVVLFWIYICLIFIVRDGEAENTKYNFYFLGGLGGFVVVDPLLLVF